MATRHHRGTEQAPAASACRASVLDPTRAFWLRPRCLFPLPAPPCGRANWFTNLCARWLLHERTEREDLAWSTTSKSLQQTDKIVSGMRDVIDELSPDDRRRVRTSIRAINDDVADRDCEARTGARNVPTARAESKLGCPGFLDKSPQRTCRASSRVRANALPPGDQAQSGDLGLPWRLRTRCWPSAG